MTASDLVVLLASLTFLAVAIIARDISLRVVRITVWFREKPGKEE